MKKYFHSINLCKLYKDPKHAVFFGVCAGLAQYLNLSRVLVRLVFVMGFFFFTSLFWIYILFIFILEKEPERIFKSQKEKLFWRKISYYPEDTLLDLKNKFNKIHERLKKIEHEVILQEFNSGTEKSFEGIDLDNTRESP